MLLQIIDDVLVLSKIESGSVEFSPVTFSIAKFFKGLTESLSISLKKELLLICPCDKDFQITFDPTKLNELVSALFVNANKFTSQGSITINYEVKEDYRRSRCIKIHYGLAHCGYPCKGQSYFARR